MRLAIPALTLFATVAASAQTPPVSNPQPGTDQTRSPGTTAPATAPETTTDDKMERIPASPAPAPTPSPTPSTDPSPSPSPTPTR